MKNTMVIRILKIHIMGLDIPAVYTYRVENIFVKLLYIMSFQNYL